MSVAIKYKKELIDITSKLPENKLKELVDFAEFLKAKSEETIFSQIKDSTAHVRNLRVKETKRVEKGKKFIEELIAWQKSDS